MDVLIDVYRNDQFMELFEDTSKPKMIPYYVVANKKEIKKMSIDARECLARYYSYVESQDTFVTKLAMVGTYDKKENWTGFVTVDGYRKGILSVKTIPDKVHSIGQLCYTLDDGKEYHSFHIRDTIIGKLREVRQKMWDKEYTR